MAASPSCLSARNTHNDAFDNGGMRFEVLEPFKRVRLSYEGSVCVLENPMDMMTRGTPLRLIRSLRHRLLSTLKGSRHVWG